MTGRGPIRENILDQRLDCLWSGRTCRRVIGNVDRESPTLDPHHRTIVKELRDRLGIERRRHHNDDEVGANVPTDFVQECQSKVGVQAAFVELVKHHGADGLEERIGQQLAVENPFCLNTQSGGQRDPSFEPELVADLAAQAPVLLLGDPGRRGPRRDPARLEHDDPWVLLREQARPHQGWRNAGRLARSRRRNQHQPAVLAEAGENLGQSLINRQRGQQWSLPAPARSSSQKGEAPAERE